VFNEARRTRIAKVTQVMSNEVQRQKISIKGRKLLFADPLSRYFYQSLVFRVVHVEVGRNMIVVIEIDLTSKEAIKSRHSLLSN